MSRTDPPVSDRDELIRLQGIGMNAAQLGTAVMFAGLALAFAISAPAERWFQWLVGIAAVAIGILGMLAGLSIRHDPSKDASGGRGSAKWVTTLWLTMLLLFYVATGASIVAAIGFDGLS